MAKLMQIFLWLSYVCVPPLVHSIVSSAVGVVIVRNVDNKTGRNLNYHVAKVDWHKWREVSDG